jgi:hypothetical protein
MANFTLLLEAVPQLAGATGAAGQLKDLRNAALAD